MRRSEKEIQRKDIDAVIRKALVCRLAMAKDNIPYIIPLSFGYDGENIYIHTAKEGKKVDIFLENPDVCFEFENEVELIRSERSACQWSFSFQSIIGHGKIREIVTLLEKKKALGEIMNQYSSKKWNFIDSAVQSVRVWRIEIISLTGKQSKDKSL